jgi:hypothetical protein
MDVRIGVLHSPKELSLELTGSPEDLTKALDQALGKDHGVLWLEDAKGRRIGIPASQVAYLEVEAEGTSKHVGFGL